MAIVLHMEGRRLDRNAKDIFDACEAEKGRIAVDVSHIEERFNRFSGYPGSLLSLSPS